MINYDFHLHSDFSTDSEEKQENIIETAIEKGLKGLCFTDHMDLYFPLTCSKKSGGDFVFDVDEYYELISNLRYRYRDSLDIRIGLEIGLRDEPELRDKCIKEYNEMLEKYPFDFIIGSTHIVNGYDPYYPEYFEGRDREDAYHEYFENELQSIKKNSNFDVYGHLDYVVRYGGGIADGYDFSRHADLFDEILKALIDKEKGLELNSGGLKKGMKE